MVLQVSSVGYDSCRFTQDEEPIDRQVVLDCIEDLRAQDEFVGQHEEISTNSTLTRRISNLLEQLGLKGIKPAKRDYAVLLPTSELKGTYLTVADIAKVCRPKLYSIHAERIEDPQVMPFEMLYEVFEVGDGLYRVIYYVGYHGEHLPVPYLGGFYDKLRPILYGSKDDYEAVCLDVDVREKRVTALRFDAGKCSEKPGSYWQLDEALLHQYTQRYASEGAEDSLMPVSMVITAWNGTFDTLENVSRLGYGKDKPLYQCQDVQLSFLDDAAYARTGMDLRVPWLHQNQLLPQRCQS